MMEVQKGIENLLYPADIITDPHIAIAEYLSSKKENRQVKKYPEWDMPRACPAFELIRARRELDQVLEGELRAKKADTEERRKYLDKQWDELRREQEVFRESFIKFNKFVRENRNKRERAAHRIQEEEKRQQKLQEEIDDLTQELEKTHREREEIQSRVQEYKKFQDYLEKVVEESSEFQSINDIFNRYETLLETKVALAEHQDQILQALDDAGTEIQNMAEEKSQVLMQLHDKRAQLQGRYDKAKATALKWENIVSRIKAAAAAKHVELVRIKACCWSLYQQICKQKRVPITVDPENIEEQLNHIKRTIVQLQRVVQSAKEKTDEDKKLTQS